MKEVLSVMVVRTMEEMKEDEDTKRRLEELSEILSKCGVEIQEKISTSETAGDRKFIFWSFRWDPTVVKTKTTRNAGGKKKWLKVTVGDMKKQLAESTLEEVAKKYGVSGRTIQRKLADAREYGLRDDDELY